MFNNTEKLLEEYTETVLCYYAGGPSKLVALTIHSKQLLKFWNEILKYNSAFINFYGVMKR